MKTKICIVDDDRDTRLFLVKLIKGSGGLELIGSFESSSQAVAELVQLKPDVVLMDINMPDRNGVDCVRGLKPLMPQTQFLMLTVYEDADHIYDALAAGATGYLLKGTRRDDLLAAIQQIMSGGSPMSSGIARKVVQYFAHVHRKQPNADILSPRERSVLTLLSKGYIYKEIASELGVSISTVDTYARRIYEKLQVHSRSEAIVKYMS